MSSFFAGIAGGLYAFKMGSIDDRSFDVAHSFDYVVMVILGGNGNLLGAVLAAFLLTYLNDWLRDFKTWRPVAYSFALVWIMVSRLPGLAGKAIEKLGRSASHSSSAVAASVPSMASLAFLKRAADEEPALRLQDVTVRFGGLVAVDRISLSIRAGESAGLIGPNGAGKSTVFNAITGIYRPSGGRVEVSGADTRSKRPNRVVALGASRTFQNIRLFPGLSVLDNVRVAAWNRHEGGSGLRVLPHGEGPAR